VESDDGTPINILSFAGGDHRRRREPGKRRRGGSCGNFQRLASRHRTDGRDRFFFTTQRHLNLLSCEIPNNATMSLGLAQADKTRAETPWKSTTENKSFFKGNICGGNEAIRSGWGGSK
jgi:hypothetical protein